MAKKTKRIREEELRKQMQDKLHQEFQQKKENAQPEAAAVLHFDKSALNAELEEHYLRAYLEEEICSQYPEFICCENHLNEVKWLTPVELEGDYEFYPVEETRFERFKSKFSRKKTQPEITDPDLKNRVDEIRKQIQEDVQMRLQYFKKRKKEAHKTNDSEYELEIYQEEIDKFYSRKKGYKKYINHLNETKWLTKEERKNQDEFTDEVETPAQIWRKRATYTFVTLSILFISWLVLDYNSSMTVDKAYLLVTTEDTKGQLYIDKVLAVGFSSGQPYSISPGDHDISFLREGFSTNPRFHAITASRNDTVTVGFLLEENRYGSAGVIRIQASYKDAGIIVNGEFRGTLANASSLTLPEGDYTLMLEKPGFIVNPPQQAFSLKAGDTMDFAFRLNPRKNIRSGRSDAKRTESGLLEVRSNIKNADIYLDGQKTNFKTDYILQQIPLGAHIVRVVKKGYKVYPDEQMVKLSAKKNRMIADFTLSSTVKRLTLKTEPVAGDIIIDGKRIGNGEVQVSLPLGEHSIKFSEESYYRQPDIQKISIDENTEPTLTFHYRLNYNITFSPDTEQKNPEMGSMKTGYLLQDAQFRLSNQAGPEVRMNKKLNENVWMIGYAFQYRNPPGQDALVLNFFIPANLDLSQPLKLKLWAYRSKDLYPLKIKGNSYYSIDVNRFRLRKQIQPGHSENEIGAANYDSFLINELLHPGYNQIMISTTTATTAHLMLWKAAIE